MTYMYRVEVVVHDDDDDVDIYRLEWLVDEGASAFFS